MTDAEREQHIRDCGRLMIAAFERWDQTGDFADRGEADYWLRLQNEAIKARSAEQVATMEEARALV